MTKEKKWFAEQESVKGIVTRRSNYVAPEINLDELARVTNNHPEFMAKVKEFLEKDTLFTRNAAVYRSYPKGENGKPRESIKIVFDVTDTYIKMFSCYTDHAESGSTYVTEASYNKAFIYAMSKML